MIERTLVRSEHDIRDSLARRSVEHRDARLGEILLKAGAIDQRQLKQALDRQRSARDKHLGRILVESGVVGPDQIHEALAAKFGIPCVRLEALEIVPAVLAAVAGDFAIRHNVLPLARLDGTLVVAMENPFDTAVLEALRFHGAGSIIPVQASGQQIAIAHSRFYSGFDEEQATEDARLDPLAVQESADDYSGEGDSGEQQRPIVRLLNAILLQGVLRRASDINIRPEPDQVSVWYRIDGKPQHGRSLHRSLLPALISRVKVIGRMNIAERRLPQEGHARLVQRGHTIDLRISVIPTVNGESVVVRVLDRDAGLKPLAELGLPGAAMRRLDGILARPHGMFLVTGPTGSGKSTTLYAVLNEIRRRNVHILTVEDPVEYDVEGIEQVRVAEGIGLGFAEVLRRFLRHDPDVIMVGEIRDRETATIACQAALTGHLVLSTLHTNDAAATVTRLIDMGIEPCILASTLLGVMAQRLVRLNCRQCSEPDDSGSAAWHARPDSRPLSLQRGRGCPACSETGYSGRAMVCEVLPVTPDIARLIGGNAAVDEVRKVAQGAGMTSLYGHALELVAAGWVPLEEALALSSERE